ncbi:MAG: efflux RND transporter permease subunit [Deltaproteobacteria bacterium]|nr:efflux RND transporter permease subunit [Deltaproteobacteria bacterium]
MFLPELAIKRPVTTFMVMLAILVFGIIGFLRLGVDQFPKVEFPVVSVTTILPGASPEVVEENITDIIEEQVATIEGVKKLTSISSHSASIVTIEFEMSRDIELAAQDVRDRVNSAVRKLPTDTEVPSVGKFDLQSRPIMWIAVAGDRPIAEVTAYAEDILKPRLETIEGVGSIGVGGKQGRAIRVWLDRDRLEAMNLTSAEVVIAIRAENVDLPGGFLTSTDIEFSVKTEGEFSTVSEFNELIVATREGYPVRLKDIGKVVDGLSDKRNLARYNGTPSVGLGIRKKPGANTVQLATLVKAEVEQARADLPPGYKLHIAFDSSVFIKKSIDEMKFALVFGGLLAALVIFLFLKNFSATLIAGLTIPLSLMGAMLFIYLLGFTLNTMTMLALTLAIGVVVDDAIIIVENIYRHRVEFGKGQIEAAVSGSTEIAFAALATTVALIAIFVPVAFMEGVVGRFLYEFGLTVALAVSISTFIALTLTPMLSSKFLTVSTSSTKPASGFFAFIEGVYKRVEKFYARLLSRALANRLIVIILALAVFGSSLVVWNFLGKEFIPPEDQSRFMVIFTSPVGSSIDYTDAKLKRNEEILLSKPEIRGFFAAIGLGESASVHKGIMFVRMTPKDERDKSQQELLKELRRELNTEPGMRVFVNPMSFGFGSHRGPPLEYVIKGPSIEELALYAEKIMDNLEEVPGIVGIDSNYDLGLPEVLVTIDRNRAADLGVDTETIARAVNTLIGGSNVTRFKEGGKSFDVTLKLLPTQTNAPDDILRLSVRSNRGEMVSLESMVSIEETLSPPVINRIDRERSITIFGNLEGEKTLGSAVEDVRRIAGAILPVGFTAKVGGQAEQLKETGSSMVFAVLLAILITYMVLASLFESFIHPLTVMVALPLSIVGALGALFISGHTVNIYSMIGITLLIGLVTKNSIILVDYTNRLREEGEKLREAVEKAGRVRLRPILMTAFSTIFGVLPTALALGAGSESRAPMAVATIGGLLTSTFLTLIVIPVVYSLMDDLKSKFTKTA